MHIQRVARQNIFRLSIRSKILLILDYALNWKKIKNNVSKQRNTINMKQ